MILALTLASVLGGVEAPRKPLTVTAERPGLIECRFRDPRRVAGAAAPATRKLGELPQGLRIHAVLKTVDGCAVNVLMDRGPDGRKLEVPGGRGVLTPLPASKAERGLKGHR